MGALYSKILEGKYNDVLLLLDQNSEPRDHEKACYEEVNALLAKTEGVYNALEQYKGAQELCREAMQNKSAETEMAAFQGLLEPVDAVHAMYNFSKSLEGTFKNLLITTTTSQIQYMQQSGENAEAKVPQALVKQVCSLMAWSLKFDKTRMERPNLSNDFSFYRRLLANFNQHPDVRVNEDEAYSMCMFTAQHSPMLGALIQCSTSACDQNPDVSTTLALLANSCMKTLRNKPYADQSVNLQCAYAMTVAVVLFDHLDTMSVFSKRSPINIKECIKVLKKDFISEVTLLNNIRYSTKTFNDAPDSIQDLFD